MKNIEIKKEILAVTKRVDNFQVKVIYWIGDGTYRENGNVISLQIDVINEDEEIIDTNISLDINKIELLDTDLEDVKALRKEQKTLYAYLSKQFNNVIMEDLEV